MNSNLLKFRLIIFFSTLSFLGTQAQENRFIYIQSANEQPFYVKMDKKRLNSSAAGYIIIPKLTGNDYKISVGYPENEWPEQNVTISMKSAGAGFLLKSVSGGEFNLVNLQTKKVLEANKQTQAVTETPVLQTETKNSVDDFARILAQVVNDPTIAQKRVDKKTEETVKTKDPVTTIKETTVVETKLPEVKKESSVSEISKLKSTNTAEWVNITYLDINNASRDTVNVFIPIKGSVISPQPDKQEKAVTIISVPKVSGNTDTRFIDMELRNPYQKSDSSATGDFVISQKKTEKNEDSVNTDNVKQEKKINRNCKGVATQDDFLKLRKQMAAADTESDMTKAAVKTFTSICFTAEQIKNLGVLFIKEEERYRFFVSAYSFVYDSKNFAALEDQLTDNYYITRFKAMVSRQ